MYIPTSEKEKAGNSKAKIYFRIFHVCFITTKMSATSLFYKYDYYEFLFENATMYILFTVTTTRKV